MKLAFLSFLALSEALTASSFGKFPHRKLQPSKNVETAKPIKLPALPFMTNVPLRPFKANSTHTTELLLPPTETELLLPTTGAIVPVATRTTKKTTFSKKAAVRIGQLFAWNSGFANACCMSGRVLRGMAQPVAAVTGGYTNIAIHLGGHKVSKAVAVLRILGAYVVGSALYGLLNPDPQPFQYQPEMATAMGMQSLLWAGSAWVAIRYKNSLCFPLAAMALGLQNSLTSVHTSNLVRSAHFSGITSDIGTFLGQALRGNPQNKEKLLASVRLAISFFLGSLVAVTWVAPHLGPHSLLVASGLQLTMFLAVTLLTRK